MQTVIQCPNCGGEINIDIKLLLSGDSMCCLSPNCGAKVSLTSSTDNVENNAINEFETR